MARDAIESPEELTARKAFPIVGVGASAGGLEAFTHLLRALPADFGMALVLVQHLSPKYESVLTELLSKASLMPVSEIADGMVVEPNHVYVIPPNASVGVIDGVLHLMPRGEGASQHMPIDLFFRLLAEDRKGLAIGVVLSGTASDGALGLKAIKAEGGITLAQDPGTARYDGMPRAAIAAGAVDFVLPLEGIAHELVKIARHPHLTKAVLEEGPDPPEVDGHLRRIFLLVRAATGVDFTHYKHATIKRRIRRRMVLQKVEHLRDYVRVLEQHPVEIESLYEDVLIHVTGFFRDPETFESLKETFFPQLIEKRSSNTPLRVWIPGCSTGEEAYSFAIALIESLGERAGATPIQIFATDISQQAVDRARAGFYPESISADVSAERLRRFFSKSDGGYRINRMIRDMCVFARQDVARDPPFSKIDVISCRNLLIYLGPILQRRVLSVFHYALKPDGFLVLGTSESIGSLAEVFALADRKHKIYQRRPTTLRPAMEYPADPRPERAAAPRPPVPSSGRGDIQREIERVIIGRYAPAGAVIGADMQVLHISGNTGKYLQPAPGEPSLNLFKMAREGLEVELRAAFQLARKRNEAVRRDGLRVRQNGHVGVVNIEVMPIRLVEGEKHFLVLFHDAAGTHETGRKRSGAKGDKGGSKIGAGDSKRLRDELAATREYLQSIIQDQEAVNEELQSANEEVLSSNEELQSTNEELETAKEELQSTNEELNTLNDELQTRNQEVNLANGDLTNLLASVQIPIIMVSSDLRIRRFTPAIERIFNVIPGDIGRPIGDFKAHLNVPNIEQVIRDTIETVSVRELEVQDAKGAWYLMRVRPYKSLDNRIEGAVVTLQDIDAVKRSVSLHHASDHIAAGITEIVHDPIVVLDSNYRVRNASRSFYRLFRISPQEAQDRIIYELDRGSWNVPRLRTLLEDLLVRQDRVEEYAFSFDHPQSGASHWTLNAIAIGGWGDPGRIVLLGFRPREGHTDH